MTPLDLFKKFILTFISLLGKVIGFIPVVIYGYIYSTYFTIATYQMIGEQAAKNKNIKSVLDIGTATGHPLYSIVDKFGNAEILGIDINRHYIPACQKLFKKHPNVTIKEMNFYELEDACLDKKFDIIIFGSSYMLMPDQMKALEIAKKKLSQGGKIYFLLTLYDGKSAWNSFMEKIKPSLKYLTTVDFGKVTYKKDFHDFLDAHQLEISYSGRCTGNFFLKVFKFYIYETKAVC